MSKYEPDEEWMNASLGKDGCSNCKRLQTENKKLKRKIIRVRKLRKQYADNNMNFLSGKYVAETITQVLKER